MKNKNKITFLNVVSNLFLQFVTILSGFIIPKIILNYFGSEVNGLVSSLNQLLNYVSLLEGGVTSVVMANLYKPLYDNDTNKISSIINTADSFYKKVSYIFVIYTFILALIYPIITSTSFSFTYIFCLTIILSFSLFIQYCFSLSLKCLLNSDKKVYIVSITQSIIIVINILISIVIVRLYPSIHLLKLFTSLLFLIQPIIFHYYVNKYYKLDKSADIDSKLLSSRWDGFSINIAYFVHANTDITILTFLTNLSTVSVYSVYSLVTGGLRQIVTAISNGISPSIGRLYAKGNNKELNEKFDIYEHIIFVLVFFLFSVGMLLITPFVSIYTNNIKDANYNQLLFGYIIILAEGLYVLRSPYVQLAYSANKFKDMKVHAYIEAFLNISISLLLVKALGLLGVAIGTLVAMLYRTIYQVIYLQNNILNRSFLIFVKKAFIFILFYLIGFIFCKNIYIVSEYNITTWLISAFIYSFIMLIISLFISFVFYRKETFYIISYFKKGV